MANFTDFLSWENIAVLFNSAFTTSLVGALAGAYAGAMAAQRIAEGAKEREQFVNQIRSVNATMTVAFTICNIGFSLKKQHVKELYNTFVAKKAELAEFKRKHEAGQIARNTAFEFQADFRKVQMPLVPVDLLRGLVYEKLSITGRPWALVATLSGVVSSLADVMATRDRLIEGFKELGPGRQMLLPPLYFGLPFGAGHVSTEYADTVEGLQRLSDDLIFFGALLVKDVKEHGEKILAEYKAKFKDVKESVGSVDFEQPQKDGLMPNEVDYQDWLRGFPKK